MKLKRSQLVRLVQEAVRSMAHQMLLGSKSQDSVSFTFDRLEMGPIQVVASIAPQVPATRFQPAEGGEVEIEELNFHGKSLTPEEVVEVENTVRMSMGEEPLTLAVLERWLEEEAIQQEPNTPEWSSEL